MKKLDRLSIFGFLLIILVVGSTDSAMSQTTTPDKSAEEFYRWYLNNPNKQAAAVEEKLSKRRAEILTGTSQSQAPLDPQIKMRQYLSKRLAAWIASAKYESYGTDYFLDAQERDDNWQPVASKSVIKGDNATLTMTLAAATTTAPKIKSKLGKRVLTLKMVKEDNLWKIDSVNNRKPN